MTPEQIKRCAEGAPPPCEYSEALTFLATAHMKLVEALQAEAEQVYAILCSDGGGGIPARIGALAPCVTCHSLYCGPVACRTAPTEPTQPTDAPRCRYKKDAVCDCAGLWTCLEGI